MTIGITGQCRQALSRKCYLAEDPAKSLEIISGKTLFI